MIESHKKLNFTAGTALGFLLCLLTYYIYFINLSSLTNVWFGVIRVALCVTAGVFSILQTKKIFNGFITFKEAFSSYFLTLIIGTIISYLFLIFLFQFIFSVEKIALIKQTLTDFNIYIMKLNYATKADIQRAIVFSNKLDPSDTIEIIKLAIKYLLFDCLIGFFVALIFRNKRNL